MEHWVTDKFYSHFPSYSGEKSKRESLDKDRQDEYNQYLSRLASAGNVSSRNVAANKNVRAERDVQLSTRNEDSMKRNSNDMCERGMPLSKENMDLPGIFNEEIIKLRNHRVAEERHHKNLEYQRELLEQIEQKRKEAEERKAKEIEADERLTRKVEAQLRSVRLQDEIEKAALARKRDYRNYQKDLSVSPKENTSSRSMNRSPRRNHHSGRLSEFDCGKENLATAHRVDDADIYKYFANTDRESIDMRNMSFRSHPDFGNEGHITMESHRCHNHTYPMKKNRNVDAHERCARCESIMNRAVCNFCEQNRFLATSQYENCATHGHHPHLCKSCYYESICACCRENICARCNRPTKSDNHLLKSKAGLMAKQSPRRRKPSPKATNLALLEESYEDSSDDDDEQSYINRTSSRMSSPKKFQPHGKPYSFNIDESSMFHPSNAGVEPQITAPAKKGVAKGPNDDLKRITDEKLSKYAKNYGDMRARNTSRSKMIDMDPYPMPLLAQQNTKRQSNESNGNLSNKFEDGNSPAFKQLETRWQIPFTQKNAVSGADNNKNICILTQSGAFKKQLQMDKFKLDFERSDDDHF